MAGAIGTPTAPTPTTSPTNTTPRVMPTGNTVSRIPTTSQDFQTIWQKSGPVKVGGAVAPTVGKPTVYTPTPVTPPVTTVLPPTTPYVPTPHTPIETDTYKPPTVIPTIPNTPPIIPAEIPDPITGQFYGGEVGNITPMLPPEITGQFYGGEVGSIPPWLGPEIGGSVPFMPGIELPPMEQVDVNVTPVGSVGVNGGPNSEAVIHETTPEELAGANADMGDMDSNPDLNGSVGDFGADMSSSDGDFGSDMSFSDGFDWGSGNVGGGGGNTSSFLWTDEV